MRNAIKRFYFKDTIFHNNCRINGRILGVYAAFFNVCLHCNPRRNKHGVSSMGRAACVNNFKLEFPLSNFSIHIHVYVTK